MSFQFMKAVSLKSSLDMGDDFIVTNFALHQISRIQNNTTIKKLVLKNILKHSSYKFIQIILTLIVASKSLVVSSLIRAHL